MRKLRQAATELEAPPRATTVPPGFILKCGPARSYLVHVQFHIVSDRWCNCRASKQSQLLQIGHRSRELLLAGSPNPVDVDAITWSQIMDGWRVHIDPNNESINYIFDKNLTSQQWTRMNNNPRKNCIKWIHKYYPKYYLICVRRASSTGISYSELRLLCLLSLLFLSFRLFLILPLLLRFQGMHQLVWAEAWNTKQYARALP